MVSVVLGFLRCFSLSRVLFALQVELGVVV